jgi:hypothetical protein
MQAETPFLQKSTPSSGFQAVWAKNGPKTAGKRSKKLAKQENVTDVANSKRTHNGPKCPFCSSRRT